MSICTLKQYKCPHNCEVPHEHIAKDCRDSLVSFANKEKAEAFFKANFNFIKNVDSVIVQK